MRPLGVTQNRRVSFPGRRAYPIFLATQFMINNGLDLSPARFDNSNSLGLEVAAYFVNNLTDDRRGAFSGYALYFICYLFAQLWFTRTFST